MSESARVRAAMDKYRSRLVETGLAAQLSPDQVAAQIADVSEVLAAPHLAHVRTVVDEGHRSQVSMTSGSARGIGVDPVRGSDGRVDVEASVLNGRLVREALATPTHGSLPARILQQLLLRAARRRTGREMDEFARRSYQQMD